MNLTRLFLTALTSISLMGCVESAPSLSNNVVTDADAGSTGSDATNCLDTCQPECSPDNSSASVCVELSPGCFEVQTMTCTDGTRCDPAVGKCSDSCVVCTAGETGCSQDRFKLLTCVEDEDSCTSWVESDCEGGVCFDSQTSECREHPCETGDTRCNGDQIQSCVTNPDSKLREWTFEANCADFEMCVAGGCECEVECTEGEVMCDGEHTRVCESDGATGCNVWVAHPCDGATDERVVACGPEAGQAQRCTPPEMANECALPKIVECIGCEIGVGEILCPNN